MNIKEIKARCEAATPGPWTVDIETEYCADKVEQGIQCIVHGLNRSFWSEDWAEPSEWDQSCSDAKFVAAARTDLPALVDWVERARKELFGVLPIILERDKNMPQSCKGERIKTLLEELK